MADSLLAEIDKKEQLCASSTNFISSTAHSPSCAASGCSFENVPRDVLSLLFSYLPSTRDLGNLSCVCKRFYLHLKEDNKLWECLCTKWWAQKEFNLEEALEKEIVRECAALDRSKGWSWFGSCLAHEDAQNGLTWAHFYDDREDENLEFGQRYRCELHGWGISLDLNEHVVRLGRFAHGQLDSGEEIHPGYYKFTGSFFDNEFDGNGIFKDLKLGWTYEGHWKNGQRNGKGTIQCPNGFTYSGEWENDLPKDKEVASNPLLKQFIGQNIHNQWSINASS